MNMEQEILNALERGKAFGFAEGMRAYKPKQLSDEQIHNIYLHQGGVAEGLIKAGADADFPVMFARAILDFCEVNKEIK